jgi:type IV secretion system protein VirB1
VQVESGSNPFAIGVVGAHLTRQPRTAEEALVTARWLHQHHFNFSVGLAQVNQANFIRQGLTFRTAFDPCLNLKAAAAILEDCYLRAYRAHPDSQSALRDAFSCYNSGNFTTGLSHRIRRRRRRRPGTRGPQRRVELAAHPCGYGFRRLGLDVLKIRMHER